MGRLIDADALKTVFHTSFGGVSHAVIAGQIIDEAPTIDPVKHGRWTANPKGGCNCSVCRKWTPWSKKPKFCEECGAKMDL